MLLLICILGTNIFGFYVNATSPDIIAKVTTSTVYINGQQVVFEAYNIAGYNYFKLRDLAQAFNETEKKFNVVYTPETGVIALVPGIPYESVGGELNINRVKSDKKAIKTTSEIYNFGVICDFEAYNIDGYNFFKLRDIMKEFNIYVGYDEATGTITLDTSKGYFADAK